MKTLGFGVALAGCLIGIGDGAPAVVIFGAMIACAIFEGSDS
jgi:hypothetical protein